MNSKIQVTVQDVYGRALIYPVCAKAKLFAELTDTKTFAMHNLVTIKLLGYEVEYLNRTQVTKNYQGEFEAV